MRLPTFSFQSLLVVILLIGVILAGWDYARMRQREIEIRDKYEQLLRDMYLDLDAVRATIRRLEAYKAVVDKHGLAAEAEAAYRAERQRDREALGYEQ